MKALLMLVIACSSAVAKKDPILSYLTSELTRPELHACTVILMPGDFLDSLDALKGVHDFYKDVAVVSGRKPGGFQSLVEENTFCVVIIGFGADDLSEFSSPRIVAHYQILPGKGNLAYSTVRQHPVQTIDLLESGEKETLIWPTFLIFVL